MARDRHVPQHHLVAAVLARREVFREPFGPPQRQADLPEARIAAERQGRETQLEDVRQLVANRVAKLGVAAPERQGDAAPQELGHPKQPFGRNERQDVRLLEIAVRRIHN